MQKKTEPHLVDATPQLRAVLWMMSQDWHPNDMSVALNRSREWVRKMRARAKEFLDYRGDLDEAF